MNDFIDYMFKVPIFHLQVRNWETKKEILLEMAKTSDLIVAEENFSEIKTDYYKQKKDNSVGKHNNKVLEVLKEEIEIFCNYFEFNSCTITSSWFELANQGGYHGVHNHGTTGYSSVCYIDYDKSAHTPTQFVSPFHNFLTGELLQYGPEVEEGSIIFFPSSIMHYTEPNTSEIERTILSFNIKIKNRLV
jgi:hypothetical protein